MIKERHFLFLIAMALTLVGVTMVFSASGVWASQHFHNSFFFLKKKLLWMFVGLIALTGAYKVKLNWVRDHSLLIFMMNLFAVLLTYSPLGVRVGGAQRWVRIMGFNLQPSEMMKFVLVLMLSAYFAERLEKVKNFKEGFIYPLLWIIVACIPVLGQPDFGTTVMIGFSGIVVLFIAGVRWKYILSMMAACLPLGIHFIVNYQYRLKRVLTFLDPWKDPQGNGFQIVQSFLAIGRGQVTGVGLGKSTQKLFYLPEAHTDFIFSILAEELGFVGSTFVLILFVLLTISAFRIAMKASNNFECFLATGIASLISMQAIFNVAVVTGSVPTKGIPLPFISFGGSSLVMTLLGVGVLMNISRKSEERSQSQKTLKNDAQKVSSLKRKVSRRSTPLIRPLMT